jgi:hypothetical protein
LELGVFDSPVSRFEIERGVIYVTLDYRGVWTPAHQYHVNPRQQSTVPLFWFVEESRVEGLFDGGLRAITNHRVWREWCGWTHRLDNPYFADDVISDGSSVSDDEESLSSVSSGRSSGSFSSLFTSDEETFSRL